MLPVDFEGKFRASISAPMAVITTTPASPTKSQPKRT
jgi:hypothetical protein